MKNKLTKAQEKRFDEFVNTCLTKRPEPHGVTCTWNDFRLFLADELSEQKEEIIGIVEKHIGSCDGKCDECETARDIIKSIKKI